MGICYVVPGLNFFGAQCFLKFRIPWCYTHFAKWHVLWSFLSTWGWDGEKRIERSRLLAWLFITTPNLCTTFVNIVNPQGRKVARPWPKRKEMYQSLSLAQWSGNPRPPWKARFPPLPGNAILTLCSSQLSSASHLSKDSQDHGVFPLNKSHARFVVHCDFVVFLGSRSPGWLSEQSYNTFGWAELCL